MSMPLDDEVTKGMVMDEQRLPIGVAGERLEVGDALELVITLEGHCIVMKVK